jgi:glutathione S-transferase
MKLYGSANNKSFNTLKIRFALAEIGAPYELVSLDLAKGESRTADFKRLNPHGKVPVLLDGDFALPESDAILWYLGEKHQDANLLPRLDGGGDALQARAQILRFLDIASTAFYPAYSEWWTASNSDDPAKRSDVAADSALVKVKRALDVLETTLASGEYLVGGFSLADVANVSILFVLKRKLQLDPLAGHERVRAWYQRVIARPTWQSIASD